MKKMFALIVNTLVATFSIVKMVPLMNYSRYGLVNSLSGR